MASILNSSSSSTMVLATAMAVSGTVIVLALRLQKSLPVLSINQFSLPRSCISSSDGKRREKKKKKGNRVHFAKDVVDPVGNSQEFRKRLRLNKANKNDDDNDDDKNKQRREMPANRMALYNGILRHRVVQRPAYFS